MLFLIIGCAVISLPITVALVFTLNIRSYWKIVGLGLVVYALDALLLAGAMVYPEALADGQGGSEAFSDTLKLGGMGMLIFSPIGVPLVMALALLPWKFRPKSQAEEQREEQKEAQKEAPADAKDEVGPAL